MKIASSRTPNDEQRLAIEHFGGVSLKAGAGAGKTFVIVEHLIYIIQNFLNSNNNVTNQEKLVRDFLSNIVLMTFTNKAVGEISIRVQKRVDDLCVESSGWEVVRSNLSFLNITTIHGFCLKLIRQGLIPEAPLNFELVDENIIKNKILEIIKRWFAEKCDNNINKDLKERLEISFNEILKTIFKVMMSPDVRMEWKYDRDKKEYSKLNTEYFKRLFDLLECDLDWPLSLENYHKEMSKDWFLYLNSVEQFFARESKIHSSNIGEFYEILARIQEQKRFPTAPKNFPEIKEVLVKIKKTRDELKKYIGDINAFLEDSETNNKAREWINIFYQIYDYVEDNYYKDGTLSFGDLEFLVACSVKNNQVAKKIATEYRYFIVDEFQDTSSIQFQILSQIIEKDYHHRIFCVGDLKQAIYGFRGGEITVFDHCIKETKRVLSLKNNYRSSGRIIDFNNQLFDLLFKKGIGFSDSYFEQVAKEDQVCPIESLKEQGDIFKICVDIQAQKKPERRDFDKIEARGLMNLICEIENKARNSQEKICVLYKNLKPSFYLIGELLKTNFNFSAQTKMNLDNDPLNYMVIVVLECFLFRKTNEKLARKVFGKHLMGLYSLLGFHASDKDESKTTDLESDNIFNEFCGDYDFYGLDFALEKFIYSLNLSLSDIERNYQVIKDFCKLSRGNPESLYLILKENCDVNYSLVFAKKHVGNQKKCEISIMTAHASKGLEFSNVLLGGIHTNGSRVSESENLFGKWPFSFKWKKMTSEKEFYKSPEFVLEELTSKKIDFNESMRLFYVACTRAVNRLGWVELCYDEEKLSYGKSSWVDGLHIFQENNIFPIQSFNLTYNHNIELELENNLKDDSKDVEEENYTLPLLHIDNIGITLKESDDNYKLGLISETSVTRLTDIYENPQRFYLNNILKINEDKTISNFHFNNHEEVIEDSEKIIKSSSERGNEIHEILEETIKMNGILPRNTSEQIKKQLTWVLNEINELRKLESEFVAEQVIKFDVFGQMLTGIPDLICISKDKTKIEIWDFKTGQETYEKNQKYFFQLFFYAYAIYKIRLLDNVNFNCILKIVYVDEQKKQEKEVTHEEVIDYVREQWGKLANFNQAINSL